MVLLFKAQPPIFSSSTKPSVVSVGPRPLVKSIVFVPGWPPGALGEVSIVAKRVSLSKYVNVRGLMPG